MGVEENGPRGEKFRRWLQEELKRRKQQKGHNAEKHGVFSADRTMPGEDPREFEELHSALIDEWKPSGPTEEDAVFSLADLIWRKRRAQIFLRCKLSAITRNPEHEAYDEEARVPAFIEWMRADPEGAFEGQATFFSLGTVNYLKENFPRSKYESTSEWAEAVITELDEPHLSDESLRRDRAPSGRVHRRERRQSRGCDYESGNRKRTRAIHQFDA